MTHSRSTLTPCLTMRRKPRSSTILRRVFLRRAAITAPTAAILAARSIPSLKALGYKSPNEKLNLAAIGYKEFEPADPYNNMEPKAYKALLDKHGFKMFTTHAAASDRMNKVSDGLYRSAQPTAQGMKKLKTKGVVTVIKLRSFHSDRDEIGDTGLGPRLRICVSLCPDSATGWSCCRVDLE